MINLNSQTETRNIIPIPFERSAFVNNTAFQDCCESLTSAAGQELFAQVTSADALEIVSTSANDNASGTGARTIAIVYLDQNGTYTQIIRSPNGLTPVALTGIQMNDVLWMGTLTLGSLPTSAGNIILRKVGTSTIFEQITSGSNRSKSGRFRVPENHIVNSISCTVTAIGQAAEIAFCATQNDFDKSTTQAYLLKDATKLAAGGSLPLLVEGFTFTAGQYFKVSAIPDAVNQARVFGTLFINLVRL